MISGKYLKCSYESNSAQSFIEHTFNRVSWENYSLNIEKKAFLQIFELWLVLIKPCYYSGAAQVLSSLSRGRKDTLIITFKSKGEANGHFLITFTG